MSSEHIDAADNLNEARALRVTEIINDFRTLQFHIQEIAVNFSTDSFFDEGHAILQRLANEAIVLLSAPFVADEELMSDPADDEGLKKQLQRIILDASVRRFRAHRIYLKIATVRRWEMECLRILQDPTSSEKADTDAVEAANKQLQKELLEVTDSLVFNTLWNADARAGHWLADDPSLPDILSAIKGCAGPTLNN